MDGEKDNVYVMNSSRTEVRAKEVVRRTPTGQVVTLCYPGGPEQRFGLDGYEVSGGSRYHRDRIVAKEEYDAFKERAARRARCGKAQEAVKHALSKFNGYGDCDKVELRQALEVALARTDEI